MGIILLVTLLFLNCKIINLVKGQHSRAYSVDSNNKYNELSEDIEFILKIYGNKTQAIEFLIRSDDQITGSASLTLYDNNGEKIGFIEQEEVSNVLKWEKIWKGYGMPFCVEQLELQANESYHAIIQFDLNCDAELYCISDDTPWNRQIYSVNYNWLYYLILITMDSVSAFCGYVLIKKGLDDKIFFIIAISFGLLAAILIAPVSQGDEYRHFIRAYEIARGKLTTEYREYEDGMMGNLVWRENGMVPIAEIPEELNQMRLLDRWNNFNEISYEAEANHNISLDRVVGLLGSEGENSTAVVSQTAVESLGLLSYLPQVIYICIGKALGIRPFLLLYMARMGNVIACAFLTYICLRLIPRYRAGIWATYFIPSMFILRSSCSPDSLLFTLIMVLISFILYLKENKLPVCTAKHIAILLCLISYVAIMKLPYVLLIGVLVILDKNNFKNEKHYFIKTLTLVVALASVAYICYSVIGEVGRIVINSKLPSTQQLVSKPLLSKEHIQYIVAHIKEVIIMFGKNMFQIPQMYINGIGIGSRYWFIRIYGGLLLLIFMLLDKLCDWKKKILMFLLYCGIWLVILIVGFSWLRPDLGYIWGINGRYMLPMIPILFIALPFGNEKSMVIVEKLQILMFILMIVNLYSLFWIYWF